MAQAHLYVDGVTTHYYGQGEADNWDDLRFPASSLNPPGSVSDADVDPNTGTLLFAAGSTEQICGIAQMPHSWHYETPVRPHIHWGPTTTGTGDVLWRLSYKYANVHGEFQATYRTIDSLAAAGGSATAHQLIGFGSINMTGMKLSTIILWTLQRIGGDASDTYAADARLIEVDFHYQINSVGSGQEFVK